MAFTHYWSDLKIKEFPDEIRDKLNEAFQDFLKSGVTVNGQHINLYTLFVKTDKNDTNISLFDTHFHEYSSNKDGEPLLFVSGDEWPFCKTARKSYDVAVVLTLALAAEVLHSQFTSDADQVPTIQTIEQYILDELCINDKDIGWQYDIKCLTESYYFYRDLIQDLFSDKISDVEESRHVSRICDLPDHELKYITKQIAEGVTSIYLNNGQIVDVSFRT